MRAVERLLVRSGLPVSYSQGFNPRPVVSLPCPRPVSVATEGDPVVVSLEEPVEPGEVLSRLNERTPVGMRFLRAEPLPPRRPPRVLAAAYRLELTESGVPAVQHRLEELKAQPAWLVERRTSPKHGGRGRPMTPRPVDLKPLLRRLAVEGRVLELTLQVQGDRWARPSEVLRLLGLDERGDLAELVRTAVECGTPPGGDRTPRPGQEGAEEPWPRKC